MGRRINGGGIVRGIDALCALSGNVGIPGGGSSFYFWRRRAFDHSFIGRRPPPRAVLEPLFGPDVLAMNDPPIRAVWVTAGNPVAMLPESQTIARALASRELLVVADSFLTDTARLAHLVLPTPTLLEADDLLGAYGHHWVGSARPVVPPPPEVRSDLEIMQGLAARTGLGEVMAGDAQSWKRRILRPGMSLEEIDRAPRRSPHSSNVLFEDRKFKTPSGKVNLMVSAPPSESRSSEFPLWLLSLSTDKSQSSQWAIPLDGPAEVTVHPDAAAGIADGGLARVESPLGSLRVKVRHDARQRRDVVLMAKGGHLRDGRCANALIKARTTDHGEGGALYDEGVRLVADRAAT
jgi:anaerobic selenocysteine-containing dehydrogenase